MSEEGGAMFVERLAACRDRLNAGAFAEGEALARAIHDDAAAAGAWQEAGKAALILGKVKANQAKPLEAIEWTGRAVDSAERAGDQGMAAAAWVVQAGASAVADRPGEAIDALGRALRLSDVAMAPPMRRSVLTGVAIAYNALELPSLALPAARRALHADLAGGAVVDTTLARWNFLATGLRVHAQLVNAEPPAAAALLHELVEQIEPLRADARAAGSGTFWAGACHVIGQLLSLLGRHDEAIAELQEALRTATEEPAAELQLRWIDLAEAQLAAGQQDAARESALAAEALASQVDAPANHQRWLDLSRLNALLGRHETALQMHRRFHEHQVHVLTAAIEHQLAELTAQLTQRTLQLENVDLRERYAELANQAERLGHEARTDALTGVLTRRGLHAAFATLLSRGSQPGPVGALLVVDLDHFKRINDEHSHLVGDAVLKCVAGLLAAELRLPDAVGRYGGEEFVVLLAGVDAVQARRVAERLLQAVRQHDWAPLAPGLAVAFSGGLVSVAPGDTFDAAFARADALLYRAKALGRARIELGEPPATAG
jgi:diguanylate cyclase (GGDEF)-like protein